MYDSWTLEEYLGGTAPDAAQGLNLVIDNYNHGVQVTYKIYTPEEIAADPRKDEVELYYFPAKTENAKYALVVPGNMYEKSAKMREGCSVSYQMHEMGYASFVLRYSVGRDNSDNAAYNDLVRAVQFITEHAEMFGVQPEDYALVGFSAGGQMCGVFGTSRMGYKNYACPSPARCCWATRSSIICTASRSTFTSMTAQSRGTAWPPGTTITILRSTPRWTGTSIDIRIVVRPQRRHPDADGHFLSGARRWTKRWKQTACPTRWWSFKTRATAAAWAPAPTRPGGCTTPWIFGKKSPHSSEMKGE